jgi:beta-galactosidase
VILWSTGNEITERGGLSQGYTVATHLAETVCRLDPSRPISNGICSLWSGLDDQLSAGQNASQNAAGDADSLLWEHVTEPFTNGLDVVGYNYLEDLYEQDHAMYPERVILGSENFPKEIGFRWPMVERLPYVIGDFTWTAWDYIGEAGIGKTAYVDPEDPKAPQQPWDLMPQGTSPYPWRLANDADIDITGIRRPQGDYRSVVWGSEATHVYSMHPDTYGKKEVVSMWGFPGVRSDWNYEGREGAPIEVVVFSRAEEVVLLINDKSVGKKPVSTDRPLPCSARFDVTYEPGEVTAISYRAGREVSRDTLVTTGAPARITLLPEKETLRADGHDAVCVEIRITDAEGRIVPNAQIALQAGVTGEGILAGFGSAEPITEEDYTDDTATTCRGRAMAILRSGYVPGRCTLTVSAEGLPTAEATIEIGE